MDSRTNRVFRTERRDINYPLWRKKVDASIFKDKAILIPKFMETIWKIPTGFKGVHSKKSKKSNVKINFEGVIYNGYVTDLNAKTRKGSYRLFYDSDLADILKEKFLMTYMRDLEFKLGTYTKSKKKRLSIEDVIPFHEFLDIEYTNNKNKTFIFKAHYTHTPTFPNLFKKILQSTVLKSISMAIDKKTKPVILKNDWQTRNELKGAPDQPNVLYMLYDNKNKKIYIGEAISLKARVTLKRPEIPHWTHFRYSTLPPELEPFRVLIEKMLIRDFASILKSKKTGHKSINISDVSLMNKKIDSK